MPGLSDAPANGSISGFPLGRVTKVRSGLNGVLGPTAPATAAVSGVRSNDTGSSMSVCMVRVRGANDDTSLSFVIQSIYTIYVYIHAPLRVTNQVKSYILAHFNGTCRPIDD